MEQRRFSQWRSDLKENLDEVVKTVLAKIAHDESCSIRVGGELSEFVRINNARIRQTGTVEQLRLTLSLVHENREGSITIALRGDRASQLDQTLKGLSRVRERLTQSLPSPYATRFTGHETSTHSLPGELLPFESSASSILDPLEGVDAVGIYTSGTIVKGLWTSEGAAHWFDFESFIIDFSLMLPNHQMAKLTWSDNVWHPDLYKQRVQQSRELHRYQERSLISLTPGRYRTYLEPRAVAEILGLLGSGVFSEGSIRRGQSPLTRMREEGTTFHPKVHLSQDFSKFILPQFNSFGELFPTKIDLVTGGALTNSLISASTAKEFQLTDNRAEPGELLIAPFLKEGTLQSEALIPELGTGIYLSDLHYLNWSDLAGGRFTGLTRYAALWVEDGEIVGPIETMRFDDILHRILGSQLVDLSSSVTFVPERNSYDQRHLGGVHCPGILLNELSLTL